MKILLVDDSRVTREVLKVYLVSEKVTVLDCADGLEALALMRRERPDAVIADYRMPKLDGPGLCMKAAADPELAHIPIVILSSSKDEASRNVCLGAGARAVLSKPIQPDALKEAVRLAVLPVAPGTLPRA